MLEMAVRMTDGLEALETELAIAGITAARLGARQADCTATAYAAGAAKSTHQAAADALQAADATARVFIVQSRQVLSCFLGHRWGARWESMGFPDASTEIPRRQHQRWNLCAMLQGYFVRCPQHEMPALRVTAIHDGENHQALCQTRSELARAVTELGQKLKARAAAFHRLRLDLRYSMLAIANTLPADDPRWHRFGLNAPADPHVPERVASLELQPAGSGAINAIWPRAPRATRYRPYVQVVGQDAEPQARARTYDPRVTLTGFAAGDRVRVHILAANATGEAAPSPVAEWIME
jgi:hypothetical protein